MLSAKHKTSDFIYTEECILNASKVSTLMFQIICEDKMSKYGWNNIQTSISLTDTFM